MRAFIEGANRRRERLSARLALVDAWTGAFAAEFRRIPDNAAMRTDGTIRPPEPLKMSPGGFFIIEDRIGEIDGHRVPLSCYLHSDFSVVRQVHNCRDFGFRRSTALEFSQPGDDDLD